MGSDIFSLFSLGAKSCLVRQWLAALGATLAVLGGTGCADRPVNKQARMGGYHYTPVFRDSSGNYIGGVPSGPEDVAFYHYGFRRADLENISPDMEQAIKIYIESKHAVPPECVKGIKVVKIIGVENASLLTANIECR